MTFDIELTAEVLARRVYNEEVNARLQQTTLLRVLGPYVAKDRVSIDVGAATGHITNYLAPRSLACWSFEAVYPVWQQLIKMKKRHANLYAVNYAVSNFNGKTPFFVDDKRLSNSGFLDLVGGPSVDVAVIALDSYFGRDKENTYTDPIGFIKIDVEGTEIDVLVGAREIIKRDRPSLMVEVYEPYSKGPLSEVFQFLMSQGYECFYYDHSLTMGAGDGGLVQVNTVKEGVEAVQENHAVHDGDFLFTPQS